MSSTDLSSYPGYYPPSKRPFWTRMKVGIAAALVGLFIGASGGGEASTATEGDSQQAAISELENDVEEQQAAASEAQDELGDAEGALADAQDELAEQRSELKRQAKAAARQQASAVREAVANTRAAEQRKAKAAVAQARQEAAAAAAPPPAPAASPQPLAGNSGGSGETDPQFSYCYEANDAGYGNYVQGQDPEYDWYDDADGDGRVCEF